MNDALCRINAAPGNFRKENLRITRSYNALLSALPKLLERRNFRQITVNDLCDESQLSRTAFYTYFQDKYDLLKCWLKKTKTLFFNQGYSYTNLEKNINDFIRCNTKLIKNLLEDADGETWEIVHDYISMMLNLSPTGNGVPVSKNTVLSVFCSGGIMNCLLWQIKKNFPQDTKIMNPKLYEILNTLFLKGKNER